MLSKIDAPVKRNLLYSKIVSYLNLLNQLLFLTYSNNIFEKKNDAGCWMLETGKGDRGLQLLIKRDISYLRGLNPEILILHSIRGIHESPLREGAVKSCRKRLIPYGIARRINGCMKGSANGPG
ncbi:MAG: hypothetical protein GY757_22735 [bacterium]|nr:hypothetical protein [bacterium]